MDHEGLPLDSLLAINRLEPIEKTAIYTRLLPEKLCEMVGIDGSKVDSAVQAGLIAIVAPPGLPLVRIKVRARPDDADSIFFLELADTAFQQMELSFCIIRDPAAERFNVDVDDQGRITWFASQYRNIAEEQRAMQAGLFPNQVRRGLRMFGEFFPLLERFTDSLGRQMIVGEPMSYDNAIRYERYGFEYLRGKELMLRIDREFQPGGRYFLRLDKSTPFRQPGMERTVRGRSWAIHDGILGEPWDDVHIYKMIGEHAGVDTFPDREQDLI